MVPLRPEDNTPHEAVPLEAPTQEVVTPVAAVAPSLEAVAIPPNLKGTSPPSSAALSRYIDN